MTMAEFTEGMRGLSELFSKAYGQQIGVPEYTCLRCGTSRSVARGDCPACRRERIRIVASRLEGEK